MSGNVQSEISIVLVYHHNITEAQRAPFWGVGDDPIRSFLLPCGGEPLSPGGFSVACLASTNPTCHMNFRFMKLAIPVINTALLRRQYFVIATIW